MGLLYIHLHLVDVCLRNLDYYTIQPVLFFNQWIFHKVSPFLLYMEWQPYILITAGRGWIVMTPDLISDPGVSFASFLVSMALILVRWSNHLTSIFSTWLGNIYQQGMTVMEILQQHDVTLRRYLVSKILPKRPFEQVLERLG